MFLVFSFYGVVEGPLWLSAMAAEGLGDNPLELAVDRAEFLRGPLFHQLHRGGVEPQQESPALLFVGHRSN